MVKVRKINKTKKKVASRPAAKKLELSLPTGKNKPCEALQDYSILLYGAKKIGKTSLASMFPDTFFLFCEPGGKGLSTYSRPVRDWNEFKGYVDLIAKDKKFKTVVIDTSDYAYEYCMDYVCKKLVIDHPSDEGWGKGWKAVKKEFTLVLTKLLHSGKGVIFISHSREEEISKRSGDKFHRTSNTMPGQAKELLEGIVDVWGFYTYEGKRRVLLIEGDDYIDAGHRLENRFKYPDGSDIRSIPMGSSKEQAFKNFLDAFENKLQKPTTTKKKLKLRRK